MARIQVAIEASLPYLRGFADQVVECIYLEQQEFTPSAIKNCDALLVRSINRCDATLLKGSKVKLIASATAGLDHIDLLYCKKNGIEVRSAKGANARGVALWVASALSQIALERGCDWRGKTLGIVGYGCVGHEVERIGKALQFKLLLCDPLRASFDSSVSYCSIDELAKLSDVITLHTPLTMQEESDYPTYHLVNEHLLALMSERRPVFINASRGAVVDSEALIKAKEKGFLSELCLDVWENEPCISVDLLEKTFLSSPHIAGFSAEGKARASRACLAHLAHFFHLEIPHLDSLLPAPMQNSVISFPRVDSFEEGIYRSLLEVFSFKELSWQLKKEREAFEELRKTYPYHRECEAYSLRVDRAISQEELGRIKALGFRILSDKIK